MKDYKLSELVGVYDDVVPKEICERAIKYFEECDELGHTTKGSAGFDGYVNKSVKDSTDLQLLLHLYRSPLLQISHKPEEYKEIALTLFNAFKHIPRQYILSLCEKMDGKVEDLYSTHMLKLTSMQVQRYKPNQSGYPAVHVENTGVNAALRLLAPIIYLNDVDEGGETEILLAGKKVKPKAGRMLVIPAGIPFWHCGHPSPKTTKYIVTSWVEFQNYDEEYSRLLHENVKLAKKANQPTYQINPNILAY